MGFKKLLLIFILLGSFCTARAGHEGGAIILTYKSVAAITGDSLQYVISGYNFYDLQSPFYASYLSVDISSSCFPNSSVNLPIRGSLTPNTAGNYCTSGSSASYGIALYQDTITLPGICADFRFSSTGFSGRYFSITNINDNGGNPYFYADLDNTHGPNSVPSLPTTEFMQGFCINKPLNLYGFTEPDGDSVYYSASAPFKITGSTVSQYPYNTGYSAANPIGSAQGYNLNTATGHVQTQLSAQGNFLVTIEYEEYRTDTATGSPVKIAEGSFTFSLTGVANCSTPSFDLQQASADSLECGTNTLTIGTTRKIAPATMTSSGSEFTVYSPSGNIPVTGAQALSDTVIEIQLGQAAPGNTTVSVYANNGTDGDVILSVCGEELTALADTIQFFSKPSGSVSAAFNYTTNFLSASFNSGSSQADSVIWDFGDGSAVSNTFNPVHNYASPGQYSVSLIAFNDCGLSDTVTQNIQVCDTLEAAFSYSSHEDSIVFDASGSSGASSYQWDFGDGNTAQGDSVDHRYSTSGTYIVLLTVTNPCGDTATFADSIETCPAPVPSWTYNIVSTGGNGMTVDFDGTASQHASTYHWDFGDGNTDNTTLTPTHLYTTPSLTYYVSLSVVNACGDTVTYGYRLSEIGLEERHGQTELEIYPNPATDILKITSDSDLTSIRLFSLKGERVLEKTPRQPVNSLTLSLDGLSHGTYLIQIISTQTTLHRKIIKK